MIYTDNTRKAMEIAYNAHAGQVDKAGMPYIFHPIHLAEQMQTEDECIVAILHDVIEDTSITLDDLKQYFSNDVIAAIKLLTHDKSVDYMEYVYGLKSNEIAKKVKLADLHHNSDLTRLSVITSKDEKRLEKYEKAIAYLNS